MRKNLVKERGFALYPDNCCCTIVSVFFPFPWYLLWLSDQLLNKPIKILSPHPKTPSQWNLTLCYCPYVQFQGIIWRVKLSQSRLIYPQLQPVQLTSRCQFIHEKVWIDRMNQFLALSLDACQFSTTILLNEGHNYFFLSVPQLHSRTHQQLGSLSTEFMVIAKVRRIKSISTVHLHLHTRTTDVDQFQWAC